MFLKECARCCVCAGCGGVVFKSVELVDSVGVAGGRGSKNLGSGEVGIVEERFRAEGERHAEG
jgi:hypothetical protein